MLAPRRRDSILIDARVNALPGAHGIARSVMKLTAHMADPGDGLALRVLVNPGRAQLFPLSEIPAHADVIETGIALGAVHRCAGLARLLRTARAGVVYVPYPTFAPLIRTCPIVVTVHDCTIESDAAFAGGRHRQEWISLASRTVLRRSAAVTVPSAASLADVRRTYPRAVRPTLVPHGVDLRQFGPVSADRVAGVRGRYGLPRRFVLAVGARRPHKNHATLVLALAGLPAEVSLVIAGQRDPGFRDDLPGLVAGLGLGSRVLLLPGVADEDLPALYRAASAFALPSLAEGFGLPALEAMAAGIPVVASDIPVLAEVTGRAALLVPPLDAAAWTRALARVLTEPGTAAALTRAGAAVAAEATWERGARVLRDLLAGVARAGAEGRG